MFLLLSVLVCLRSAAHGGPVWSGLGGAFWMPDALRYVVTACSEGAAVSEFLTLTADSLCNQYDL